MRSGECYPRAPWVHHTHDGGCSWWPTPRAMLSRVKCHLIRGEARPAGMNLEEVIALRGETGGYANPRWIEWLMGFPDRWCVTPSTVSETLSSPRSPSESAG